MKRIRYVAGRSALATTALAVVLSGCSALNPAIITEPYPASDGVNLDLPGSPVALRNFLVIGDEKGAEAVLIGSLINDGTKSVQVSLQADLGETAQPAQTLVTVGPKSSVQIGPEKQFEMILPELPVEPGATTKFTAQTTTGGKSELIVPVLRPQDEYQGVTPAPTTASPSPSRGAKAGAEPSDSASPDASAEPSEDAAGESGTESSPEPTESATN